jgi:hypothetical protein
MTDHRGDSLVSKSTYQAENVANAVQHRIRQQIIVERYRPGSTQSVTPQIGCNDVEAGTGQRKQLIAPTIGKFWKAVQQHHTRFAGSLKSGFKDVQDDTIVRVHAPGTHAERQGILSILDAIILRGACLTCLHAFTGSHDSIRGKQAQRLKEMPSRKWTVSHIHWISVLQAMLEKPSCRRKRIIRNSGEWQ